MRCDEEVSWVGGETDRRELIGFVALIFSITVLVAIGFRYFGGTQQQECNSGVYRKEHYTMMIAGKYPSPQHRYVCVESLNNQEEN